MPQDTGAIWPESGNGGRGLVNRAHACDVDDALWARLRAGFSEEAILELLLLAGFYRMMSYLTNALRLPLEPYAARFPA